MADIVNVSGSLRNRLTLTLIGGAAVLAVVLFIVVRGYAAQIAQQGQDSILEASVTSILDTAILRDGQVEVDFPYASLSMLGTDSDDRVFYAIYQDDTLLSGYKALPHDGKSLQNQTVHKTATYVETHVRMATASRILVGANTRTLISVSVAQTQDALQVTLARISRNVGLFGAGFFLLSVLLSFWATATTIRPLKRLTGSVTKRGPKDLSPVASPVPVEMAQLVTSLNSLMGRLDTSLRQSEDFIAEAAHRVRTPLATVRSHAEATLQRVDRDENRQALRSMIRAIDESSRAAGQLLDHAMTTFRADHLERVDVDLVEVLQELVLRLTPFAEMKDIDLVITGEDQVIIQGDSILLQNGIRNLIDNALKYSPAESEISIRVTSQPKPTIEICDQGQGFPEKDMDQLVSRFSRGDNIKGIIGSGLGLTIANDVALAHGGTLTLNNRPGGGACVTFSF
ncbi:two-component system, OmpR family, sensor histidine kinase TctE [Shimia gijangensis]|uniref:histidine kinase n=1 Tax=Shimia gijangensis TaxID=1470563 RepID=A0A1M6T1S9_9RHOB|nr:sensor histidine kinase [Shimia gijangensis]SHK50881.1 two-component system, OmpR family, sensor histidine kinase TctE [Shimia gijangensis]